MNSGGILFLLLILLMFVLLLSLFSRNQHGSAVREQTPRRKRSRQDRTPNEAARLAAQRAGYEGEGATDYVQVLDIGLLAYRNTDEPKLVRYHDVLLDTRYLRPFVDLWLPFQARGPVRFELVDGTGRVRYVDEHTYDLVPGENTLLPNTWLPLRDDSVTPGQWRLRVLASNTLLAAHVFGWQPVGGGEIQEWVAADGELSATLQQALQRRQAGQRMSLDELLADQEEWTG